MLGNVVLGLGVALEVFAGAAALPGEGLVLAVSTVLHKPFSSVKIANDVILVLWLYFLVTAFSTKYTGCGKELLFRRYASASL